mgnify:CR=1 FL=1
MTTDTPTARLAIAVVGAGGKMGMRVSNNLSATDHAVSYVENSPAGRERTLAAGRELTDLTAAVAEADIVVLAVPDLALGAVTAELVPQLKSGAIVLTLDPAAAYAGLLATRDDVVQAVAHPCHPSVFLERTTKEEWADTFGGIAAPQDAIAAIESDDPGKKAIVETTVRAIYAPVVDVHWVTVKQLAQLEPTLVETVACMIGALLNEALDEAIHTMGVPEAAARERPARRQPVQRRVPHRDGLRPREHHQGKLEEDLPRRRARQEPRPDAPPRPDRTLRRRP